VSARVEHRAVLSAALSVALSRRVPTSCRPGLRRGPAPMREAATAPRTVFDRLAILVLARADAVRASIDARRQARALAKRLATLVSFEPRALATAFEELRARIDRCGHDERTLVDGLAHAVLAAERTLGLSAREGQRVAALALLHGRFVEMPTGEGKTLAVALAAAVAALDGTPVHVMTANDYLAERDAAHLAPLYGALGLSAACVLPAMGDGARRAAYARDIVHVTGKQVAFDWLRDALAGGAGSSRLASRLGSLTRDDVGVRAPAPLLRGLCLAIVDEADSLLIDEARTPLVLAAERAETGEAAAELVVALGLAERLREGVDFRSERPRREIALTAEGRRTLERLSGRFPGTWQASRYRDERVRQALVALHLLQRDRDYIVRDGQVELVDEQSGRTLPDRRLQHGLQRLLEIKEKCKTTPDSDIVAAIPFQRFFGRYLRLVGTSGTLEEVRDELAGVYRATLLRVPPERTSRRCEWRPLVVANRASQLDALVDEVRRCRAGGRPVLVGTRSVEQSSGVASTLAAYGIPHRVLNACQDLEEAAIVSIAGEAGQITVATNMAGRGTDIPLGAGVAERGGLHVVSLAFNDAHRIDRQLAGRAARQGEPGTFRRIASLDEPELVAALPAAPLALARRLLRTADRAEGGIASYTGPFARRTVLALVRLAQRRVERRHARERRVAFESHAQLAHHVAIGGLLDHPA